MFDVVLQCFKLGSEAGSELKKKVVKTFTAKVHHGRFKYLRFNLPASTLVDLKFTPLFCLK
jgi:hypothetical protein